VRERATAGPLSACCRLLALTLALICSTSAFAAQRSSVLSRYEFSEPHMGTTFRVVLYAPDKDSAERAQAAAFARIADLDARLSDYRADSELMRACRDAAHRPVVLSDDVFRVLSIGQELSRRSGGAFDLTVGALTHLWRRARREVELPPQAEMDAARAASGYTRVHLDPAAKTLRIDRDGVRIDTGGIAKGYAADRALDALRDAGLPHAMVVAGGDIAAGEAPPGSAGWQVTIAPLAEGTLDGSGSRPSGPEDANARSVLLHDAGISTSGDAEQWVEIAGTRYSHILDPRTGRPLTGHMSVTVIAPDATTSDMLATTVAVLGETKGLALAESYGASASMTLERTGGQRERVTSTRWTERTGGESR
jgi:thiamine biosynthesis lipoprotein